MGIKRIFVVVLLVAMASVAQARSSVPLVLERDRVVLASSAARPASVETVKSAIVAGGARHEWTVRADAPGKLTLAYNKGGKHEVVVDVVYDETGFQIRYVSSVNMSYELRNGAPLIHPYYDDWVDKLGRDISGEFAASQAAR